MTVRMAARKQPTEAYPEELRGEVLYQDEEAPGSKARQLASAILVWAMRLGIIGGLAAGAVLLALNFDKVLAFAQNSLLFGLVMLVFPIMIVMFLPMVRRLFRKSDLSRLDKFRIYSGGFSKALRRDLPEDRWSSFYPMEDILEIDISLAADSRTPVAVLKLRETLPDGTRTEGTGTLTADARFYDEIVALRKAFPEKCTSKFNDFIANVDAFNEDSLDIKKPGFPKGLAALFVFHTMAWFSLLYLEISILSGLFSAPSTGKIVLLFIILGIFLAVGYLLVYFTLKVHTERRNRFVIHGQVTSDGFMVRRTMFQKWFTSKPETLPHEWIRSIKLKHLSTMDKYGEIVFTYGEEYLISFGTFKELIQTARFEKVSDAEYVNRAGATPARPPGLRKGAFVLGAVCYLGILAVIAVACFLTIRPGAGANRTVDLALSLTQVVLATLLVILQGLAMKMKPIKFPDELFRVDAEGIQIPGPGGKKTFVKRTDIQDVSYVHGNWGNYCVVKTRDGQEYNVPETLYPMLSSKPLPSKFGLASRLLADAEIASEQKKKYVEGPGSLLHEEPEAEFQQNRKRLMNRAMLLAVGGASFLAGMFIVYAVLYPSVNPGYRLLGLWAVAIFSLFAVWELVEKVGVLRSRMAPWRMYENGLGYESPLDGKALFFPYGELQQKEFGPKDQDRDQLVLVGQNKVSIRILPTEPDFARRKQTILGKLRDSGMRWSPEKKMELQELTVIPGRWKYWAVALVFSLLVAIIFTLLFPGDFHVSPQMMFLHVLPLAGLASLFIPAVLAYARARRRMENVRTDTGAVFGVFILLNLAFLMVFTNGGDIWSAYNDAHSAVEFDAQPVSAINLSGHHENETMDIADDLVVRGGESLVLVNCTVTFNCTRAEQYFLWVAEGGSLDARGCKFTSVSSRCGFGCQLHGEAYLEDCVFERFYGDPHRLNGDGGIEIWSSSVEMANCTVKGAITQGLMIVDSGPTFHGCLFADCADEDVEVHRGTPRFENCTFKGAGWGLIGWDGSSITLDRCIVADQREDGITLSDSKAEITNTTFDDIRWAAIQLEWGSSFTGKNNEFLKVGETVDSGVSFVPPTVVTYGESVMLPDVLGLMGMLIRPRFAIK